MKRLLQQYITVSVLFVAIFLSNNISSQDPCKMYINQEALKENMVYTLPLSIDSEGDYYIKNETTLPPQNLFPLITSDEFGISFIFLRNRSPELQNNFLEIVTNLDVVETYNLMQALPKVLILRFKDGSNFTTSMQNHKVVKTGEDTYKTKLIYSADLFDPLVARRKTITAIELHSDQNSYVKKIDDYNFSIITAMYACFTQNLYK